MSNARTHTIRCRVDDETARAVDQAATRDERSASDWMRAVIRRELRRLRLLTTARRSKK